MCAISSNNMAPYQELGVRLKNTNNAPKRGIQISMVPVLIVLGVILVGVGIWFFVINRGLPDGLSSAPTGEVIKTLPKELVFEKDALIEKSYAFNYPHEGTVQSVVRYISKEQMARNVLSVRSTLVADGWITVQDANEKSRTTFLYAQRNNYKEEINITFEEVDGSISVTVAYAKKDN